MTSIERLQSLNATLDLNYLAIFSLTEEFTDNDLKKSYRKLSRICHPDLYVSESEEIQNLATEVSNRINHIYEVLQDPVSRDYYIEHGEELDKNKVEEAKQAQKTAKEIEEMFSNVPEYKTPKDRVIPIQVPLSTAYYGGKLEVEVESEPITLDVPKGMLQGTIFVLRDALSKSSIPGNVVFMAMYKPQKDTTIQGADMTIKPKSSGVKFDEDGFLEKVKVLGKWLDVSECEIDCNEDGSEYTITGKGLVSDFYRSQGKLIVKLS